MTTLVALSQEPILRFVDNNGNALVGGMLTTLVGGINYPTWSDSAGNFPLPNPIILNNRGEIATQVGTSTPLYVDPNVAYTFILQDAQGTTIWTAPNIICAATSATVLAILTGLFTQSYLGNILYPATSGEAGIQINNSFYPPGHAWRYLTTGQVADVQGYTFLVACGATLQTGINAAYLSNVDFYLPGGGYLVDQTLIANQADQGGYRGYGFKIFGNGAGPVFVPPNAAGVGTTILRASGDVIILRYQQYLGPVTTSGNYYWEHMRFEQTSSAANSPLIQPDVLGEYSHIKYCEFYQGGVGNGIFMIEGTKGLIEQCNIINRDYLTVPSSRIGTGLAIGDQYNAGLLTIRKVTSRGFQYAFTVGSNNASLSCVRFDDCEASNNTTGWLIYGNGTSTSTSTVKCLLDHCYSEGITGTVVQNLGYYTTIRDCFFQLGFTIGIDDSNTFNYGTVIENNYLETRGPNCILINIASTGAFGGNGKYCGKNTLLFSTSGGSVAGVVGIQIAGIDPRIDMPSNSWNPRGPWTGGTGTFKVNDLSTSSGLTAPGNYGQTQVFNGNYVFPALSRGVISYGLATPYGNSAMSGTTLNIGGENVCVLQFGSAQSIASIVSSDVPNGQPYIFIVLPTSGASNCTFQNGVNITLNGSGPYAVGAAGCAIEFILIGNHAYERNRTAY